MDKPEDNLFPMNDAVSETLALAKEMASDMRTIPIPGFCRPSEVEKLNEEVYRLEKRVDELLTETDKLRDERARAMVQSEQLHKRMDRMIELEMMAKAKHEAVQELFENFLTRFLDKIN